MARRESRDNATSVVYRYLSGADGNEHQQVNRECPQVVYEGHTNIKKQVRTKVDLCLYAPTQKARFPGDVRPYSV